MIKTHLMDSVVASLSYLVLLHTVYKYLSHKKFAKLTQLLFSVLYGVIYFIISYSAFFNKLIPNIVIRQILIPLPFFILLTIYIAVFFNSDIKHKMWVFIGTVISMFCAESTMVFLIMPFDIFPQAGKFLQIEERLLLDLTILFLYTAYNMGMYFILMHYESHFPWKITFNICSITISCILLFLLVLNVSSINFNTLRVATIVSFACILVLILSLLNIMKYLNKQEIEKKNLYWKREIHDLNIKYSQTIDEKSCEIRRIQHDIKDNVELLKLLIEEGSEESKQKASEIISELNSKIETSKIHYYTNNIAINALLTNKVNEAKQNGILLNISINIPKNINLLNDIKALDIDVLLINLLNNAIEACNTIADDTDKVIELKMEQRGNFLFIKTINPYSNLAYNSDNTLKTTKQDTANHGIGMSIIDTIVKTYEGAQTITTENNQFIHTVSLDLESKPNEY